jgi:type II restriction enzyme
MLTKLTDGQLGWIEAIITQFDSPFAFTRTEASDIVTPCVLGDFGDSLRIHHCFSKEAFTKDKFEYAWERVLTLCGVPATLAPRGNPGHDITIAGVKFSLKTQANKGISRSRLHISKFMELGKGQWGDNETDLIGLRDQFFKHMESYERILVLRTIARPPEDWEYELTEIPKSLLERAKDGTFRMMTNSKQFPKPGYCYVYDEETHQPLFELYFDGGTERKLQIKNIDIEQCTVHARWIFPDLELQSEG